MTKRVLAISLGLCALNAVICWPLFRVEYLDDFQSNEGSWIVFAKFLRQYWPHVSWFSWSDGGMPFENTYLPGVSAMVAMASMVAHTSPAHAFHFLAALAYSLAPVSLFLFAAAVSGRLAPGAIAALLWSLVSPSIIFPDLLREMGTPWGIRRLRDIVFWGDTPHNVAVCLLPVALLLLWRFLEKPSPRRFALAALAAAAVMIMNAFGIVVMLLSSAILYAARKNLTVRSAAGVLGILLAAYLVVCRFLPPSLIRLLATNSQFVAGDFRFTARTLLLGSCFLAVLMGLWLITRRISHPLLQFAVLFSACFGGITLLGYAGINLVPQPGRYHLEMEPGFCLLLVLLLEPMARRISWKLAVLCVVPLALLAYKDAEFARALIKPADIQQSLPYREAIWIAKNLPGRRVLDASEGQWLFNLFAENPQMSSGHEPSAPNWVQSVAVYTIHTGQNAGADDGLISVLWLKAFGCGAIVVPGRDSRDHYHAIANPEKFDGLLSRAWRESGDSIYQVPLQSPSLAHVIPRSEMVTTRPSNGLDVAQLRRYVAALESRIPASIVWENPEHARITAKMSATEVLSVQTTYDPGWEARVGDRKVKASADGLGLIQIEPDCSECTVDLRFNGGPERKTALGVSLLAVLGLFAMLFLRTHA